MASKTKHPYTIVRGGKLVDIAKRSAKPAEDRKSTRLNSSH